jgi:hypothetical protein
VALFCLHGLWDHDQRVPISTAILAAQLLLWLPLFAFRDTDEVGNARTDFLAFSPALVVYF